MINKIPVELDSDYEISGTITAFILKKTVYTYVRLLADIKYPESIKKYTSVNIYIYDKDCDIIGQDCTMISMLGLDIRIPDDAIASKVILRTRKIT